MVLMIDGQHHFGSTELSKKWTTVYRGVQGASTPSHTWTIAAEGRTANCIKVVQLVTGQHTPGYIEVAPLMTNYGPWTPTDSGVCGFAIKVSDLTKLATSGTITKQIFAIYEGGGRIFFVVLNPNGTFSHNYHQESALGTGYVGSSTQGLRSNVWSYVEFKWTVADDPDGQFVTRLNTIEIFNLANSPAAHRVFGSSATYDYLGVWDAVRILQLPFTATTESVRMCDFYLADQEEHSTDYVLKDFAGDGTIGAIYPEGVGDYAEFTPDGGGNNFDKVKEHPPDGDTTTVSGATPGLRDVHVMQDVPAGAVIISYQSLIYAKKTSVGAASLAPMRRMGGVDYVDTSQGVASADDYSYIIQPYDNDPADGTQATETDINDMKAGYKKTV